MSQFSEKFDKLFAKGVEPLGPNVYIDPDYEFTYRWHTIKMYDTFVIPKVYKNLSEFNKSMAIKTIVHNLITRDMIDFKTMKNKSNTITSYWIQDTPDTAYQIKAYLKTYGYISPTNRKRDLDMNIICMEVDKILNKYRDPATIDYLLMRPVKMKRGKVSCVKRVNLKYLIPIREWLWNGKVKTQHGTVWFPFVFLRTVVRYASAQMRSIAQTHSKGKGRYIDEDGTSKLVSFWFYSYGWRLSYNNTRMVGDSTGVEEEEFEKLEFIDEELDFDEEEALYELKE